MCRIKSPAGATYRRALLPKVTLRCPYGFKIPDSVPGVGLDGSLSQMNKASVFSADPPRRRRQTIRSMHTDHDKNALDCLSEIV